ncbi:MAG: 30S ribosomal protein S6 [Clostridia bacterium]|nr:30S ribosomal protein S6 [Clostridia bacterium]
MNNYEAVIILSMKVADEEKVAFAEKMKEFINKNGELANIDEWGKRTLAYDIKKEKEGFYIVLTFTAKPESMSEMDRILRLDERVLKYIVVKK